jgi:hypothetical protein
MSDADIVAKAVEWLGALYREVRGAVPVVEAEREGTGGDRGSRVTRS